MMLIREKLKESTKKKKKLFRTSKQVQQGCSIQNQGMKLNCISMS